MTLVGFIIWPLLAVAPIIWLASWFASKRGVAPYENVTRREYLDERRKSPV
jgi:hypothetical protein